MKNKCILSVFTFIITFLLFSFNVKADVTFTFDSSYDDFYNNNFAGIKSYADNKLTTLGYSNYLIWYNPNSNTDWRYRLSVFFVNSPNRFSYYSNNFNYVGNIVGTRCYLNINNLSEMSCQTNPSSLIYSFPLMYSTTPLDFTCSSSYGTFIFTNGTDTYDITCSDGVNNSFVTYDDLLVLWNSEPPTPPDDTPLLTSFFNLVIDRLTYLCEELTSSYIYLSIFGVLIIYIVILLFRRLL